MTLGFRPAMIRPSLTTSRHIAKRDRPDSNSMRELAFSVGPMKMILWRRPSAPLDQKPSVYRWVRFAQRRKKKGVGGDGDRNSPDFGDPTKAIHGQPTENFKKDKTPENCLGRARDHLVGSGPVQNSESDLPSRLNLIEPTNSGQAPEKV
jgi:hypothetical protein